jgi:YidC/Oxa1 family membrane protein insertase
MFDALIRLIALPLSYFYEIIPSYGLGIIFLTIVINILMFPLTLKQTRSTRSMQEIQPEVKKLQKLHKDDPETLNKEMMALYKDKGVNPAGCLLPMLIQLPVWFALFRLLREPAQYIPQGTRLAQALAEGPQHFLGMNLALEPSKALSVEGIIGAIPYLVLVLLVVATGWIQQKQATPQNQEGAGAQAQMVTKLMPLLFGIFSFSFPAGLDLYFVTANIFRIGQQAVIFALDGRPEPPSKHPAKEDESGEPAPPKKPHPSSKKKKRRRRKSRGGVGRSQGTDH